MERKGSMAVWHTTNFEFKHRMGKCPLCKVIFLSFFEVEITLVPTCDPLPRSMVGFAWCLRQM